MNRWKDRRDAQRGGPPRTPKPCGTVAAARRHQRNGEPLCEMCEPVWAAHQHDQYLKRKRSKS